MNTVNELYNPENGILRMITDLEGYINPVFTKYQPLLYALASIAFILIPLIAIGILSYLIFYRKHRILKKLTKKNNYIWWGIALLIYIGLSFIKHDIGYGFTFNTASLILPVIAKFSGPYIAGIFGILQYLVISIITKSNLSIMLALIAGVSGMIYGMFFYRKRTKYSRCLGGKLVVSIICNVFLTTFITYLNNTGDIAYQLTKATIDSVFMAPVHALIIFGLFKLVRYLKHRFTA